MARLSASPTSVLRSLIGATAALALLLQALFAVPLATRMAADAMQLLPFEAAICVAATDDVTAASDHRPVHPLPAHHHAQCLICAANLLPVGLLVLVAAIPAALFGWVARCRIAAGGSSWRADRYHSYRSRAPPLTV